MRISEAKEQSRGVFWVVEDKLFAFPFIEDSTQGIAKSGLTYNHKKLWGDLNIKTKVPYNYYPRGRVEFDNRGRPIIWMNPNIDSSYIPEIKVEFGLRSEPKINYDYSEHYKCYLDDNWKPDKS